ncbi:uncharacterized protein [Choristoneura fumiferana]|uniref:uncharacterized protein n=1 Tax=Choristoneura fumiferana TaxID=7141 RepID=UPI003D15A471
MEKEGYCGAMSRACRYKQVNFAIATAKGSPLREGINLAIVDLKANGIISKLWRKWMVATKKSECDETKDEDTSITEMTLSQVAGIFYVLVGGLSLALGVALVEFCQHGRAEAARANVPLRAALTAKARLASRGDHKPHAHPHPARHAQRDHDRLGWNGGAYAGVSVRALAHGQGATRLARRPQAARAPAPRAPRSARHDRLGWNGGAYAGVSVRALAHGQGATRLARRPQAARARHPARHAQRDHDRLGWNGGAYAGVSVRALAHGALNIRRDTLVEFCQHECALTTSTYTILRPVPRSHKTTLSTPVSPTCDPREGGANVRRPLTKPANSVDLYQL